MALSDLRPAEMDVLHRCMKATAQDAALYPDWEFPTIFGLNRAEFIKILGAWPELDEAQLDVQLAIQNSLNNLLGYPHQYHDDWDKHFGFSKAELIQVFKKWRGALPESYFDGLILGDPL